MFNITIAQQKYVDQLLKPYPEHEHLKQPLLDVLSHIHQDWPQILNINFGWFSLVTTLHKKIKHIDPTYRIIQIKQKFGSLRYYIETQYAYGTIERSIIDSLISHAEMRSVNMCEQCESFGTMITKDKWMRVACDEHA